MVKILEIIDYPDGKEEFADKFLDLCQQQAVVDLVKSLPEDKQNQLTDQLLKDSSDQAKSLLQQTFSSEQSKEVLKKATEEVFKAYLEKVSPSLNDQQKSKLDSYLKSLS